MRGGGVREGAGAWREGNRGRSLVELQRGVVGGEGEGKDRYFTIQHSLPPPPFFILCSEWEGYQRGFHDASYGNMNS